MEENGRLIRLFPVPFRLVGDDKQFKKWQWIFARINKAANDHRLESHKVFVDIIVCDGNPLPTRLGWQARKDQLNKIPIFDSFVILDASRAAKGVTLGLLRPSRILKLDITPSDKPDWTQEEKDKLVQHERQSGLFDEVDAKRIATLRKVPFDFHSDTNVSLEKTPTSIGTKLRTGRQARYTGLVAPNIMTVGRRPFEQSSNEIYLTRIWFSLWGLFTASRNSG